MCTVQVTERRVEGKIRAGEKIGNGASAASKEIEGEIVYSRSPWRVAHFPPLLSDCSFAYDGPFFSFSLSFPTKDVSKELAKWEGGICKCSGVSRHQQIFPSIAAQSPGSHKDSLFASPSLFFFLYSLR